MIVAQSKSLKGILSRALAIAKSDQPVIITGETGTGKSLLAKQIHLWSSKLGPFVTVPCGTIPDALAESELFGHVSGAFTSARPKEGLLSQAANGTLFLDGIDALSRTTQSCLLNAIEEKTFRKVGSVKLERSNFRVISSCNLDVDRLVSSGELRADLYWRLACLRIHLPPLRERREDIAALVRYFLAGRVDISSEALALLETLPFPGNVRELKGLLERAMLEASDGCLEASDFTFWRAVSPKRPKLTSSQIRAVTILRRAGLSQREVAEVLGVHQTTISYHSGGGRG